MKKLVVFLLLLSICLFNFNTAFATGDPMWDKGRYHTHYVNGLNVGQSAGIISVSSYYSKNGEWGMNRVRVWSRTPAVKSYFNSHFGTTSGSCWVSNVYITNEPVSSYPSAYDIYNWDPQTSNWSNTYLEGVAYDILNFKGIPSNTIAALVNGITTVVNVTGSATSKTVEIRNPDYARDLPAGVYYNDADASVNNQLSSYQAKFWYNLPVSSTWFHMAARGKINYTFRYWDDNDSVYHTWTLPSNTFSHGFYLNT
jgi:hypothetical protein